MTKPSTTPEESPEQFLYRRLAAGLRRQIDQGVLRVGDRLPSVRTLRRLHNVSAATVMQAYIVLEREGYVEARERSGFYVARPPATRIPATVKPSYTPVRVDVGELISSVLRRNDERLIPLGLSSLGPELLPTARLNRAMLMLIGMIVSGNQMTQTSGTLVEEFLGRICVPIAACQTLARVLYPPPILPSSRDSHLTIVDA